MLCYFIYFRFNSITLELQFVSAAKQEPRVYLFFLIYLTSENNWKFHIVLFISGSWKWGILSKNDLHGNW